MSESARYYGDVRCADRAREPCMGLLWSPPTAPWARTDTVSSCLRVARGTRGAGVMASATVWAHV